MGNCFARIFPCRRNVRRHIILILIGLDNAGKTKTVNNLMGERDESILPTVGFKAVNLHHQATPVTIYDLGGGPQFRQIWPQYYSEVHGVIFVIDSSDFSRLDECRRVLEEVLSHDKISGKPILVLANKQDKQGALDDIDVVEKLHIEPLVNRYRCPTLVESYTAALSDGKSKKPKLDPGLKKGYQWLLNYIESRYGDINLRVQTDIHAELERRKRLMCGNGTPMVVGDDNDVLSQTGFDNPNYRSLSRNTTSDKETDQSADIITVKPANKASGSLNSTTTIENIEDISDDNGAKPKLSPLFGRVSNNTSITETVNVELEPKSKFRKLSPLVKRKSGINHIDFKDRPQSSPSNKSNNYIDDKTYIEDYDNDFSGDHSNENDYERSFEGYEGTKKVVVVDGMLLSQTQKELVLTDRTDPTPLPQLRMSPPQLGLSPPQLGLSPPIPAPRSAPSAPRPASASQLVRKQLEIFHSPHKRRFSLRYGQRNKTSPEALSVFEFSKAGPRLDKGDFDTHSHSYLTQRDVTL